jgi:putative tryptophan/tyrosine transport system substrate-binding protein
MTTRRHFIVGLGAVATWPLAAWGQQGQVKRLGLLWGGPEETSFFTTKQLLEALADAGWTEGRNLRIDARVVESTDPAIIRPHAEALVRAAPDVIFATPATAVQVVQLLTSTIPLVFAQNGDPVQAGTVRSMARPGGNMTGFVNFEPSINTKYLQLLRDIAPQMTRVAVVQTDATRVARAGSDFAVIAQAARSLSVAPVSLIVRDDPTDVERMIGSFAQEPGGGLILPPDGAVVQHRDLIGQLAMKHRLPAIAASRSFVDAGCLMSYATARLDYRRVAAYLARVLGGANPGELPVQTPEKFNLAINLKAAMALGLTIPPSLFALADEVIE